MHTGDINYIYIYTIIAEIFGGEGMHLHCHGLQVTIG